ncbi:hypothetical protein PR048_031384 [Dryococelus australis]|uniref:Uncharacterized protein n=1 Tax=Dryococelus australis TaxID=614101 RepID=A0ABQ9G7Z4_9NEOP|nr:hypothetical protein PR048_031384 [Dryococelus australis]
MDARIVERRGERRRTKCCIIGLTPSRFTSLPTAPLSTLLHCKRALRPRCTRTDNARAAPLRRRKCVPRGLGLYVAARTTLKKTCRTHIARAKGGESRRRPRGFLEVFPFPTTSTFYRPSIAIAWGPRWCCGRATRLPPEAAPECYGGGDWRSPRNPADQRLRRGIETDSPTWEANSLTTTTPRLGNSSRSREPITFQNSVGTARRHPNVQSFYCEGAAVAERIACSPPTKATRVQSSAGSIPDFRRWESYRAMQLVDGFSRGSPVSTALAFQRCSTLTSITPIGSQGIAVKSSPNPFTHLVVNPAIEGREFRSRLCVWVCVPGW